MQDQDSINDFLEECRGSGKQHAVNVAKDILGDKEDVTVTFRRAAIDPVRLESPRRAHRFSTVEGFVQYLDKYGSENTVVLGDPETGNAQAVLDEMAKSGFEVVNFSPILHPLWTPWDNLIDAKPIAVKAFATFLIGQREVIESPSAGQLILNFSQIRVSKHVEMQSGFGVNSINGVMVETKIEGGKEKTVAISLPEKIVIETPLFLDRSIMSIAIDLIVDVEGDRVTVALSSSDAKAKRIQAVGDMLSEIRQKMPKAQATLGHIVHNEWSYTK